MSPEKLTVPKSRLIKDLKDLGLTTGEVIMLHISVKSIGWIVGGPDVVIEAILEVLGKNGTLMMMVGWEDYPYYLKTWTEEKQKAYREECPAFDPERSRANREFSIIAEYLRTWPSEKFRSIHPTCNCVTIGPHAEFLTKDHALQYGFGENSPFARLCKLEGKVLNIGAPLDTLTLLHYAEHLCDIPNKRIDRYQMPILVGNKREWITLEEFHTDEGIVDWDGEDYFQVIGEAYIKEKKISTQKIGDAPSYLFNATNLVAFGKQWMENNF